MKPQQKKLVSASDNFGNVNIKNQQGSTFEIFHYLPLPNPAVNPVAPFRFFEKLSLNKNFWQSNIINNQLDVGESLIIERIWFSVAIDGGAIPGAGEVDIVVPLGTGNSGLALSQWNWFNDNNKVIKNKSLCSHFPQFNNSSTNDGNFTKHLETLITIQPLIPFVCTLQIPIIPIFIPPGWTIYIGCHVEGVGSLFSPKHTY